MPSVTHRNHCLRGYEVAFATSLINTHFQTGIVKTPSPGTYRAVPAESALMHIF